MLYSHIVCRVYPSYSQSWLAGQNVHKFFIGGHIGREGTLWTNLITIVIINPTTRCFLATLVALHFTPVSK